MYIEEEGSGYDALRRPEAAVGVIYYVFRFILDSFNRGIKETGSIQRRKEKGKSCDIMESSFCNVNILIYFIYE